MSDHLIVSRQASVDGNHISAEMAVQDLFNDAVPEQPRQNLKSMISEQVAAYRAMNASSRDAAGRRMLAWVIADITGTGIKAGMVGAVVETQTPGNRNASFTDLTGTAHLMRFAKKSLDVWAKLQPEPPTHLPVGAELWLRDEEVEVIAADGWEQGANSGAPAETTSTIPDLPARVAALELLVEQLIFERVMMTDDPAGALRQALGGMTQLAGERPEVPPGTAEAAADVLVRVMNRLGEG